MIDHVGAPPTSAHMLDRINNDGNYEPGNVRWATRSEQCRNKRNNALITAFGETKCVVEWTEDSRCMVNDKALLHRLFYASWSPEEMITRPSQYERWKSMKTGDKP